MRTVELRCDQHPLQADARRLTEKSTRQLDIFPRRHDRASPHASASRAARRFSGRKYGAPPRASPRPTPPTPRCRAPRWSAYVDSRASPTLPSPRRRESRRRDTPADLAHFEAAMRRLLPPADDADGQACLVPPVARAGKFWRRPIAAVTTLVEGSTSHHRRGQARGD